MAYERINWQNEPSEATALNDVNLNKMDSAIYELDGKATTTETAITNLQDGKVDKVNGKGLSQVDNVTVTQHVAYGTVVSTIKTYKQDGTEVTSQVCNGINVDSALSDSSTNPVQNKVVKGALDNKVDKESGKGLSYYDVISVARETSKGSKIGSINLIYKDGNYESNPLYNGIEVDSSLDGTSENPVENKAIYDVLNNLLPSKTVSGNPIAISDASGFDAKSLKVTMNPIQDLNGYSNPWVGGAGKNKIDIADRSGITTQTIIGRTLLKAGTYTLSAMCANSGMAGITLKITNITGSPISMPYSTTETFIKTTLTFTLEEEQEIVISVVGSSSGYNGSVKEVQIEEGSTATKYAPYENICPISGRTEASVTRTGKNFVNIADRTVTSQYASAYFILPKGTYTISAFIKNNTTITGGFFVRKRDNTNAVSVGITVYMNSRISASFTLTDNTDLRIMISGASSGYNYDISELQVELGSTATEYEPYTAETHTHQYSDTIYGGVDDFVNGTSENKNTLGEITLNGSETYTINSSETNKISFRYGNSNLKANADGFQISNRLIYNRNAWHGSAPDFSFVVGGNELFLTIPKTTANTVEELKTWIASNNIQIVYELATPTTIETSAEEVTLLKGNNVLSTNADDIELKYSVSLDNLLPTTTRTLAKSPIAEEPKEETDETEEQR